MLEFFAMALRNLLIFLSKCIEFLPVQIVSSGDRASRLRPVIQHQISATVPWSSHPTGHSIDSHSTFNIEGQ